MNEYSEIDYENIVVLESLSPPQVNNWPEDYIVLDEATVSYIYSYSSINIAIINHILIIRYLIKA